MRSSLLLVASVLLGAAPVIFGLIRAVSTGDDVRYLSVAAAALIGPVVECREVSAVSFDHIGVFTYSHEEGTRAGEWDDDVPAATKRRRRDRLMAQPFTIENTLDTLEAALTRPPSEQTQAKLPETAKKPAR